MGHDGPAARARLRHRLRSSSLPVGRSRPLTPVPAIPWEPGTTTEVLYALDQFDGTVPVTAVVGDIDTPLARRAPRSSTSATPTRSVVQTRFPTTPLVLLRTQLGDGSVGTWAESYARGEYLHGPISVAGADTLVCTLTPLTPNQTEAITATGARIHEGRDEPLAELVSLQRHAVTWATESGRNPDVPPHLTRSVVLV